MVDRFFELSHATGRFRQGPLAGHVDSFAALLWEQGYSRRNGQIQLRLIGDLNQWLECKQLTAEQLDERVFARFLRHCEHSGPPRSACAYTLTRLLGMLRQIGVTPEQECHPIASPRERFLEQYRGYLYRERGLSALTVPNRVVIADRFLAEKFPRGGLCFTGLKPRDVTGFVQRQAADASAGGAKQLVTALRCLFRYLRYRGDIEADLAACVPSVAGWPLSSLPKSLPRGSIAPILKHCDRSTARGRRDYAILMLLARLGVRSAEITGLNLEDIDWDLGQITIRGKGGRWSKLPLPRDVGKALADYLRQDRPRCSTRKLFVTRCAPITGLRSNSAINKTVVLALARAGIDSARKGAHLFRHTLASAMLHRGASLGEIGEVLRHRSANTTLIYAKVELSALRKLALPWPGGAQ